MKTLANAFLAAVLVLMFAFSAFAECPGEPGGSITKDLLTGQTIVVGTVTAQVVGDNMVVTYGTTDGWQLLDAHVWIGDTLSGIPQTNTGNPKVGQFPYKAESLGGVTSYSFSVPLSALNYQCTADVKNYFVAAQADVRKIDSAGNTIATEGAWSDGPRMVDRGNWATYFSIPVTCVCADLSGLKSCETAYAANTQTCFLDLSLSGFTSNNWGWTIGPLDDGTYTYKIYAGAGQCDLSKGTYVGDLVVDYNGSTVTATYAMKDDVVMNEAHLYVGNTLLPLVKQGKSYVYTVAPGQYPYFQTLGNAQTTTFAVNNQYGQIYVIAHAAVCPKVATPVTAQ